MGLPTPMMILSTPPPSPNGTLEILGTLGIRTESEYSPMPALWLFARSVVVMAVWSLGVIFLSFYTVLVWSSSLSRYHLICPGIIQR
jgi:hypothetical protein